MQKLLLCIEDLKGFAYGCTVTFFVAVVLCCATAFVFIALTIWSPRRALLACDFLMGFLPRLANWIQFRQFRVMAYKKAKK